MAKKKTVEPVKPIEPESESSEEETDASSSDEEQPPQTTLKSTTTNNNTVSMTQPPDSSESESESEPEPTPNPATTVTITKRPAASQSTKSENAKKPKIVESSSNGSKLFQRLFTEEDEIVILDGMIEFEAKNKKSPTADMDAFLKFVENKLRVDVSKKQLKRKIQNMKKRFENNREKDLSAAVKPREKSFFELSDKLWGGGEKGEGKEAGVSSVVKTNVSKKTENGKKKDAAVVVSNRGVRKIGSYSGLSSEEKMLKIGEELFGGEEKIAGWEEWKKLERAEMELSVKQLELKKAKMKLVLDRME